MATVPNMPVVALNTQVMAGGPAINKANLISKQAPFQLKYGPRPEGTPGRGTFDLMNVLGLERKQYSLCLQMIRMISFNCGVDETKGIKFQSEQALSMVFAQFIEFFPEFKGFEDQFWAPRALLYVALKGSSDTWWKTNPGLALTAREAAKAHKQYKPNPKAQLHHGRPSNKSKANAMKAANAIKEPGNKLDKVANEISNMSIDEEATGSDAEDDEPFFNPTQPVFYNPSITPGLSGASESMHTTHVPVALTLSHAPVAAAVSCTTTTHYEKSRS
ncbi:hypothetical protein CTheo_8793 [Ceratobasidium theobromae]|uniref:Uncharacterized protein n=1 Tax=Ceratobasidium theobromae TaxID=1582974 RepID=A0A5N5Q8M1_9AGAM|nr:hypothetical protein CTheo_8793 [Ceratobasidium theobromae]